MVHVGPKYPREEESLIRRSGNYVLRRLLLALGMLRLNGLEGTWILFSPNGREVVKHLFLLGNYRIGIGMLSL